MKILQDFKKILQVNKQRLYVGQNRLHFGFVYDWEQWRNGQLIDSWQVKNILPTAGLSYVVSVAFDGGSQLTDFYVVLLDDFTVSLSDTYASILSTSNQEIIDYSETTRPVWDATRSASTITNNASKATFTMNGSITDIYGGGLVTDNTKNDNASDSSKILISEAMFDSPKLGIETADVLKVSIGLTLTNPA